MPRPSNPYAVYHELRVALHDWYDHNIPHWYRDEEEAPQPGGWLTWLYLTAQERHNAETELTRAPDAGRPAPRREPIRPERAADAHAEEDARLAADLAKAREAAQRLAQKRDATLDPDARAHAEIAAALEAERARRAAEALAAAQRDHEQGMAHERTVIFSDAEEYQIVNDAVRLASTQQRAAIPFDAGQRTGLLQCAGSITSLRSVVLDHLRSTARLPTLPPPARPARPARPITAGTPCARFATRAWDVAAVANDGIDQHRGNTHG